MLSYTPWTGNNIESHTKIVWLGEGGILGYSPDYDTLTDNMDNLLLTGFSLLPLQWLTSCLRRMTTTAGRGYARHKRVTEGGQ